MNWLRVSPHQQSHLLEPDLRARFLNELIQYYQPKRKAVEHSGVDGGPIAVTAVSPEQAARIAREYLLAAEEGKGGVD